MKKYLIFISLLFFTYGCSSTKLKRPAFYNRIIALAPGQSCLLDTLEGRLSEEVSDYFNGNSLAGLALHIQLGDTNCSFENYLGFSNVDNGQKVSPLHRFRIGSLTKSITASKILELIDDRKLSLEDSISNFLPGSPSSYAKIKIYHLLNHTSGIIGDFGYGDRKLKHPRTNREILSFIYKKELMFPPGSQWSYSNSGYYLLGSIIENLTNKDYFQSLSTIPTFRALEKPLSSTRFKIENLSLLTDPHILGKQGKIVVAHDPYIFQEEVFSVGSIVLTAKETTSFYRDFFFCGIFPCSLLKKALTMTSFGANQMKSHRLGYGLGVAHYQFQGVSFYGNEGYTREDTAISVYSPEYDLSITALTNTDKKDLFTIVDKILSVLKRKKNL